MKTKTPKLSDQRKKHNAEILKRMREGDPLRAFDSYSSWFPPRPVIKKDPEALMKLYQPDDGPQ